MDVQHRRSSVLISASGELDDGAGDVLQHALDYVTLGEQDLLIDLHAVTAMDADGLLHLLELHRCAESRGLRVLVTGWQPQPQQCMATVAGIPGPRAGTGERYALPGFRRLLEEKVRRAWERSDSADGWLPRT
ncbi:STAS domain-containing protein [Streptomyces sp. NPDC051555]|uniref:STAS domain-containing protein n=1 Tax=Streptomyces sp. NPDC051555 TaxID=3365657 RepID=UPI00378D89BC